jgi:hypothetical protein
MAEDRRSSGGPCLVWGGREEVKTRGGSLSSDGAKAAVQAERSTPIEVLRSLEYSNTLTLNAISTLNLSSEFIFMVNGLPAKYNF